MRHTDGFGRVLFRHLAYDQPMARKPTDKSPAQLSLVVAEGDSLTPEQKKAAGKARRMEALGRAQAARREQGKRRAELREMGIVSNMDKFRAGEYPVADWSDEEISRGRPANIDGTFDGRVVIGMKDAAAIKRELLKRGQSRIDAMYMDVLGVLHDVALHGEKDADRVKASLALAERVAGKVPERIELKSADPWQDILDDVLSDDVLERVQTEQHDVSR